MEKEKLRTRKDYQVKDLAKAVDDINEVIHYFVNYPETIPEMVEMKCKLINAKAEINKTVRDILY